MLRHIWNYLDKTPAYAKAKRTKSNVGIKFYKFMRFWNKAWGTIVAVIVVGGLMFFAVQFAQDSAARQLAADKADCAEEATARTTFEHRYNENVRQCQVLVSTQEDTEFWIGLDQYLYLQAYQ